MKYGIDIGHNVSYDIGASGIRKEDELNKEVGDKVISKLKALGYDVVYCTPKSASSVGDSLQKRVQAANQNNVDFYVSIHFNSGGGRGTEVYAMSQKGREAAVRVVNEIAALGYANRGVKDGSWIFVIKHSNAPAILIEGAFVDSQEDMNRYNGEAISNAIVKGLTGKLPQDSDEDENKNDSPPQPAATVDKNILEIQKVLNRLKVGDSSGKSLSEDGISGPKTISAIKSLQGILGITQDGIAGPKTWSSINIVLSKPLLSTNSANYTATRYLQWRAGTKVDGVFGKNTKNAVISYQKNNGLSSDGIVGNNTWTKLIN